MTTPATINPGTAAFTWIPPTTNTDGTPIQAGEITGYDIGIRSLTASGSAAGTYPTISSVTGAATSKQPVSALATPLKPDTYAAAIRSAGPKTSSWGAEIQFAVPVPHPSSPTGLQIS